MNECVHDVDRGGDGRWRNGRTSVPGDRSAGLVARVPNTKVTFAGTAQGLESRIVPREGLSWM
jgi:hypothetical protein